MLLFSIIYAEPVYKIYLFSGKELTILERDSLLISIEHAFVDGGEKELTSMRKCSV